MSGMLVKKDNKNYYKLKNLIKKQDTIINKLISKHNNMIFEKNSIIENQYSIIQEQSKNLENLIHELNTETKSHRIINKLKSIVSFKTPAVSM